MPTAYDPSDPVQQAFLSALALGETGGSALSGMVGTGGTDLSGYSTDQYGFPEWAGSGNSHAAGTFQFQPGTWDSIAAQYNLNFQNQSDQAEGAWYLAQQTYAANTGGDLETALQSKNYSSVQQALQSVWPSVTGNQANPQGLAALLSSGYTGNAAVTGASTGGTSGGSTGSASQPTSLIGTIENFFVRFGLIILGGLIILVALWQLLSNTGAVPSPGDTAKSVGKSIALAA